MARRLARASLTCVLLAIYGFSLSGLREWRASSAAPELLVSLPRFAQVLSAGGDRYLAANLSGFRVLVASTEHMRPEDFAVQARLQEDIAWLNPAHEDNYYIAAAFLPWNGHVDAAQEILAKAANARQQDWQPLFYLAFDDYHFRHDPVAGARWLLSAVPRASDQQDAWALQNLAAKWLERGYSVTTAAEMVGAMAENAPSGGFRKYLQLRAARLKDLAHLRGLAVLYVKQLNKPLSRIDELVNAGLLEVIPEDPLGMGYEVDGGGMPVFKQPGVER